MNNDPHQAAADHIQAAQELYDIETTAADTELAHLRDAAHHAQTALADAADELARARLTGDRTAVVDAQAAHDTARHHYEQAVHTYTEQTQAVLAERAAALDAITAELPQTLASIDLLGQETLEEGPSEATGDDFADPTEGLNSQR